MADGQGERDRDPAEMICYCMGVTRGRLERAIREEGARSVADLQRLTAASGGCGTCRWDLEDPLAQVLADLDEDAG